MDKDEVSDRASPEMMREAARRARPAAEAARWNLNVAILLFAVLIVVVILLFQGVGIEITGPVAVFGLALAWFVGWNRGRQLYRRFYEEELAELQFASSRKDRETVETRVQKALRERLELGPDGEPVDEAGASASLADAPRYAFTDAEIQRAPGFFGVYSLYDGAGTIYIGRAEGIGGIRESLWNHKAGREGSGTMKASHFDYERSAHTVIRQRELLDEHVRRFGELPQYNDVRH